MIERHHAQTKLRALGKQPPSTLAERFLGGGLH
jgi:hypothetical protein